MTTTADVTEMLSALAGNTMTLQDAVAWVRARQFEYALEFMCGDIPLALCATRTALVAACNQRRRASVASVPASRPRFTCPRCGEHRDTNVSGHCDDCEG